MNIEEIEKRIKYFEEKLEGFEKQDQDGVFVLAKYVKDFTPRALLTYLTKDEIMNQIILYKKM